MQKLLCPEFLRPLSSLSVSPTGYMQQLTDTNKIRFGKLAKMITMNPRLGSVFPGPSYSKCDLKVDGNEK
jgi:hypothetical protein